MPGDNAGNLTTNPFTPPNCGQPGVVFTQWSCISFNFNDDGSSTGSTPGNLDGIFYNYNAWGPGGKGNAEGRTTQILGDSGVLATPGIKNVWASSTAAYGIGDALFMNWNHPCHAGVAYQSDQGCQAIYNYSGQGRIFNSTANGTFHATVATNASQQLTFSSIGGCTDPLNQACVPPPGARLIDTQTSVTAGKFTGASVAFTGSGAVTWLSQAPTDQTTIPAAAAWGYALGQNVNTNLTWDNPQPVSITMWGGAGTFTTGPACAINSQNTGGGSAVPFGFTEQTAITAVSGTSPTQTVTFALSKPAGNIAIFQGNCQYLSLDADFNTLGVRYAFPAVSLDGHNLIYTTEAYSQTFGYPGGALPFAEGSMYARFDGGANSGFHTYYGARVTKINGVTNSLTAFVEPNSTFTVGDTVEAPDFPAQKINGLVNTTVQNDAGTSSYHQSNAIFSIGGPGAAGQADVFEINNSFSTNCALYAAGSCGGNLTPPFMSQVAGIFNTYWSHQYTPATSLFTFQNHLPGQTNYTLFSDPSWGNLNIVSNDTAFGTPAFTIGAGGLHVLNGGIHAGGGGVDGLWNIGPSATAAINLYSTQNITPGGFQVPFHLYGYSCCQDGGYHTGLIIGQDDLSGGSLTDMAFLRLQDETGGFGGHEGIALGVINGGSTYVPGFYESSGNSGNKISIGNGTNICSQPLCLGGSGVQIDSSGNLTSQSGFIQIDGTTTHSMMALQPTGGSGYLFFANGSAHNPGWFGVYNSTSNLEPLSILSDNTSTSDYVIFDTNAKVGWGTAESTSPDTYLSRLGAASVGINGSPICTAGNYSTTCSGVTKGGAVVAWAGSGGTGVSIPGNSCSGWVDLAITGANSGSTLTVQFTSSAPNGLTLTAAWDNTNNLPSFNVCNVTTSTFTAATLQIGMTRFN